VMPDAEWAAHLRRRHFPRLRKLIVGDKAYFVTPLTDLLINVPFLTCWFRVIP
jgi:hypothetical protein